MINELKINSRNINKNQTYIYSAGLDQSMQGKSRLFEEINDLKLLIKKAKIVLVSHQGSFKKIHCN